MVTSLSADLLLLERQSEIKRRINTHDRVVASDLAREFEVSEDTVRRDLRELAAAGHCIRVYGGALPVRAAETTLAERVGVDSIRKAHIAQKMVGVIERGMFLYLDVGSTNLAAARLLPKTFDLTVATNSPLIAAALFDREDIGLYVIGGKIDQKVGAAIGSQANREAERLRPDLCFLGACALDAEAGVSAFDSDDAELKRIIVANSRATLVAALNEKVGTVAAFPVLDLLSCDHLVVEASLETSKLGALRSIKSDIILA